jgi:hypothetical protein
MIPGPKGGNLWQGDFADRVGECMPCPTFSRREKLFDADALHHVGDGVQAAAACSRAAVRSPLCSTNGDTEVQVLLAVLFSTVQYSTVQYSTVQYSTVH